ncbi:MAG TPA: flavodoxin [Candidatus Methanoperedenaceae archaeon]|nr:flavodoxin [Candidatus Methanoperedenaceae archaeon]
MKILLVHDSVYGNTEKLAKVIAGAIQPSGEVRVLRAKDAAELGSIDLLIVGSPTQGGRPTPAIREFLNKIPANALQHTGVAAFDTRLAGFFVKLFGFAAGRIAASLEARGGHLVAQPEG